jgi:hypothetical protein
MVGTARAAAFRFFRDCLRRRNAYVTMRLGMHRRSAGNGPASTASRPC